MDNNDLSKIPVSELTPENIDSLKGSAPSEAQHEATKAPHRPKSSTGSRSSRLPLLIAGIVLLIGVAVALFFIFRKPSDDSETPAEDADGGSAEIVWEPESGSENPSQDYIDHHQSIIDSPDSTFEEKLDSKLSIANLYSSNNQFDKANEVLSSINRTELNHHQMYNLYSVYAYLYECMGDATNNQEYLNLARSELEKFWEEEGE